jgi:8-oxo-dGTP pyrophosphatase MutT (NUDIX family)
VSRYASVLAFHASRVVLVREEYPTWGGEFWNVPSGGVEEGETPVEVRRVSWPRRRGS